MGKNRLTMRGRIHIPAILELNARLLEYWIDGPGGKVNLNQVDNNLECSSCETVQNDRQPTSGM